MREARGHVRDAHRPTAPPEVGVGAVRACTHARRLERHTRAHVHCTCRVPQHRGLSGGSLALARGRCRSARNASRPSLTARAATPPSVRFWLREWPGGTRHGTRARVAMRECARAPVRSCARALARSRVRECAIARCAQVRGLACLAVLPSCDARKQHNEGKLPLLPALAGSQGLMCPLGAASEAAHCGGCLGAAGAQLRFVVS